MNGRERMSREDLCKYVLDVVSIPGHTPAWGKWRADYLEDLARANGLAPTRHKLARAEGLAIEIGPPESRAVAVYCHYDSTKPALDQRGPCVDGDTVYGRGVADGPGPIIPAIGAFAYLAQRPLRHRLLLLAFGDEQQLPPHDVEQYMELHGRGIEFGLACDPGPGIAPWADGTLYVSVWVGGHSGSSASSEVASNAIVNACGLWKQLKARRSSRRLAVLELTGIESKGPRHRTPAWCRLVVSIRFAPPLTAAGVTSEIEAVAARHASDLGTENKVEVLSAFPPVDTAPDNRYVVALLEAARCYGGPELTRRRTTSSIPVAGVPGVHFAPGSGVQSPNENTSLTGLAGFMNTLIAYGERLSPCEGRLTQPD